MFRRLLGLAFVGETRDAEWSLIADVVVRGLDSVRRMSLHQPMFFRRSDFL